MLPPLCFSLPFHYRGVLRARRELRVRKVPRAHPVHKGPPDRLARKEKKACPGPPALPVRPERRVVLARQDRPAPKAQPDPPPPPGCARFAKLPVNRDAS